ncbi:unnamed protein product [Rotaria sordida]|uniref:U5 small nuclear ribonucleoprotein 40 kDa protein n=1 Tax=Rotaria sordida TaxID=392033 RepID=A0A813TEC9_9BILA|nr:unnamed protein product [Rotaria sordida]CAF0807879.1 unnamed protein product [Rotaria sordida]CAF0834405.1 unnamed protein product [Rotaria sordida]CAF0856677.1 unnamed protein product [Rotaria sordida]CAF3712066.1 unnamed protein product [Rotaria sordida]
MSLKRPNESGSLVPIGPQPPYKQARTNENTQQIISTQPRTSKLAAPIMLLQGHEGEIFSCKFHADGEIMASAGFDRKIFLWNVYDQCYNWYVLTGHGGAIMEIQWSPDGSELASCSTDKLAYIWDITTCQRVKKLKGHQSFVNSIGYSRIGKDMICTGSDDGTVKIWDRRKRGEVMTFESTYQVLTCCFNASSDAIFSGGIDNTIKMWDLRKQDITLRLDGHLDSPTGLELSYEGSYLASNSMDSTVRIWDIRPYFNGVDRCIKLLQGHQHNFEKNLLRVAWSPDGKRISCGSADKHVYIWDIATRKMLYRLPGHLGSVNEVDFHPIEPIIASGSSDKTVFLGEIEP